MSAESAASRRVGSKFSSDDDSRELTATERQKVAQQHTARMLIHREASAKQAAQRAEARQNILLNSGLLGAAAGGLGVAGTAYKIMRTPWLRAQPAMSSFACFVAFFVPFTFIASVSRTRLQKRSAAQLAASLAADS